MTWDWLSGHPVLLFGFIMLVLGVPTTIAGNWQLIRSGVRRLRPKPGSVASAPKDETGTWRTVLTVPIFTGPPGYRYNGGAVSTAAAMNAGSYVQCVHTSRSTEDVLPLFTRTWPPGVNGTGTATP